MRFDVVVGNPPYNKDRYIDFVLKGFELSSNYTLMITPAKFQSKIDTGVKNDKNTEFREIILPHISVLVYYPETRDIFDILLRGGIAYYLCDKTTIVDECKVVNKSDTCMYFNSTLVRDIKHKPCLLNFVHNLLKKIDVSDNLSKYIDTNKSPYGLVTKITGTETKTAQSDLTLRGSYGNILGYIPRNNIEIGMDSIDMYKCVTTAKSGGAEIYKSDSDDKNGTILGFNTLYKYNPGEICTGDYFVACYGSESFVDSFISYLNCKLVRLLYFAHCTNSNINSFCFDLIPMQDNFNCIYEDKPLDGYTPNADGEYLDNQGNKHCSLYIKYKLTADEINIIESVIRGR